MFHTKDPSSKFSELFQAATTFVHGGIPRLVALVLGVNRLLIMVKDIGNLHPSAIGEVFFQLISHFIIL